MLYAEGPSIAEGDYSDTYKCSKTVASSTMEDERSDMTADIASDSDQCANTGKYMVACVTNDCVKMMVCGDVGENHTFRMSMCAVDPYANGLYDCVNVMV